MSLPKNNKLVGVVIRTDQDRKLDKLAKQEGRTRSDIVRDLLDRAFSIVPDAEFPTAPTR